MNQAKFVNGESIGNIEDWIIAHNKDYAQVRSRLECVRNIILNGRESSAARILERAYAFAVMSIQTERDRHERAFTAHYAGNTSLKDACLQTVYGGQKYGWLSDGYENNIFRDIVTAIRTHVSNGDYDTLLDVIVNNLKGVSYRKGAFMLAMSGLHEYMCVDSNVGRYAGIDKLADFESASEYMEKCDEIADKVGEFLPPFIVQWAIYDFERGEHSRHMAYFREVLHA